MSYGPQGTLGLDFLFSGSLRYDLEACGAQVIAGCGCVGFPVLLCCPWGYTYLGGRWLIHAFKLTNVGSVRG